jgi:site-specific DNA recombinase
MAKVTKINAVNPITRRMLRTAAYCRVSTDDATQLLSLENQKAHYERLIKANPEWEYAGLFFDEGVSGTKMDAREGLQQLLRECERRKIDFIITKSISRFARNTTGCLEVVRRLKDLGITVFFEKENINTGTMDGELLLTVLSGLAESESVSLSENSMWSIKSRMRNGTYKLSKAPFGYVLKDGTLVPHPEQAAVVRRIFSEFLSGKGSQAITRSLNSDGIKPLRGELWTISSVHWILINERYIGDVLLRKTYTENFTRRCNHGEEEQYYIRDHHEPIISREDFEQVQAELELRRTKSNSLKGSLKSTQRYEFSGKLTCGICGVRLQRFAHQGKTCGISVNWRCLNRRTTSNNICTQPNIKDEAIKAAVVKSFQRLRSEQDDILKPHIQRLRGLDTGGYEKRLAELEKLINANAERAQTLTGFKSKGYLTPALFMEQMNVVQAEADRLKGERAALAKSDAEQNVSLAAAEALLKYLHKAGSNLESFDAEVFNRYIENVIVFSQEEFGIIYKCGIETRETVPRMKRTRDGLKPAIPWSESYWAKKGAVENGNG